MQTRLEAQPQGGADQVPRLLEEISLLEQRIRRMGGDGDCAYERAIIRLYRAMVAERRQQLADLRQASA